VSDVEAGSPADKAGVKVSDIILKFDGKTIGSSIDLPRLVGATKPGVKTSLTIWRKGAQRNSASSSVKWRMTGSPPKPRKPARATGPDWQSAN
jgi:serine protease Do